MGQYKHLKEAFKRSKEDYRTDDIILADLFVDVLEALGYSTFEGLTPNESIAKAQRELGFTPPHSSAEPDRRY